MIRLLITFIAASLFGLERQRKHKPVGFGTFIFVSLGACALGILATSGKMENTTSLIAAVVTGIGFLGAGALIKGTDRVFGFTTAAAVWFFAIFGLTIGLREYIIGGILYAAVWIIVRFDGYLEEHGLGTYKRRLTIETSRPVAERDLKPHLIEYTTKYNVLSLEAVRDGHFKITYLVEGGRDRLNKLVHVLYDQEWLHSAKIE